MLAKVDRDRKLMHRRSHRESATPIRRHWIGLPESFRPDRPEVMTDFGSGNKIDIQPGVVF